MRDPSALSWLMTVVRHACMRMLRPFIRQRRTLGERVADAREIPGRDLNPEQALERRELVNLVRAAIGTLPLHYREVVIIRDIEGLSGEDAASALGIDLSTMKTRLYRAREQLRETLLQKTRGTSTEFLRRDGKEVPCQKRWRYWALPSSLWLRPARWRGSFHGG
jgi:RNA polymerase sigma-70 factor (ECF subfamily)